jgi:ribosomal protein S18 acetylase RimI-like enzyme
MVRLANRNDINRIAEIELFTFRYNFKNILPNNFLYKKLSYEYYKNWFFDSFNDMKNNCDIEYYVLEDDNIIKGYFSLGFPSNNEEIELINFIIDVPFQHNKLGTQLMDYCLELVKNKGAKTLWLNVFEKNNIGIKFYERYGFCIGEKTFSKEWNIYGLKLYKKIE